MNEFLCPSCQKRRPTLGNRLRFLMGLRRRVCKACAFQLSH